MLSHTLTQAAETCAKLLVAEEHAAEAEAAAQLLHEEVERLKLQNMSLVPEVRKRYLCDTHRVGQARKCAPYVTVFIINSLIKMPYMHLVYVSMYASSRS